jgi:hypothetical protein
VHFGTQPVACVPINAYQAAAHIGSSVHAYWAIHAQRPCGHARPSQFHTGAITSKQDFTI